MKRQEIGVTAAGPPLPTFVLKGFYPTPTGTEKFKDELSAYESSKGAVRFPLDKPIPLSLISKIVKFRVKENLERAAAKGKK